jgi:hypothetical protein
MDFMSLYSRFPDIAERETVSMVFPAAGVGVPAGRYVLLESYCTDDDCDCCKVMLNAVNVAVPDVIVATIGYGWESLEFYTKWMFGDKEIAKEMVGAHLEMGGRQSQYSREFLKSFESWNNSKNVEVFKRHYKLFRSGAVPK